MNWYHYLPKASLLKWIVKVTILAEVSLLLSAVTHANKNSRLINNRPEAEESVKGLVTAGWTSLERLRNQVNKIDIHRVETYILIQHY